MQNTNQLPETNYNHLIGALLIANGWHYDNGGSVHGTITRIERDTVFKSRITVHVTRANDIHMKSFTLHEDQLKELIQEGTYESNHLLNTGINATLKLKL